MPAERYYFNQQFTANNILNLADQEYHHLVHVMRARPNDEIELVNGQGQLAQATIQTITKKNVQLSIESTQTSPPTTSHLILAQAIPRMNRLEFILEKGTELGMTDIWLFPTTHSDRKTFNEQQIERLQAITIAAMKQCGRLFLPKITMMPKLSAWEPLPSPAFFGDTSPSAPTLSSAWQNASSSKSAFICIGPESGFTQEETALLLQLGAQGVKLHSNILRTDTAAITALSIISHNMLL